MNPSNWLWIKKAVEIIETGFTKRMDNEDNTICVYKCGNVIRIDIKL